MDAYTEYNQIKIHLPDEDRTAFTTSRRIYYYKVMHFELKKCRATLQCMVDKVFKGLIGSTMKVYVDMLVKSVQCKNHLQHLGEAFDLLRKYKMKLNPRNAHSGWLPRSF